MLPINNLLLPLFFALASSCHSQSNAYLTKIRPENPTRIGSIPVPDGFDRIPGSPQSFSGWIRNIPLRNDPVVYLYNGKRKLNQEAQYAVIDWNIQGMSNLQCADAVMWIRAKWLYETGRFSDIRFTDNSGINYTFIPPYTEEHFRQFMNTVFAYCGTASLEQSLHRKNWNQIEPGDVVIKGGYPGHAMLVADVICNTKGERRFILLQGYMPAQDLHIVRNPMDPESAWYRIPITEELVTAEYVFKRSCLKSW